MQTCSFDKETTTVVSSTSLENQNPGYQEQKSVLFKIHHRATRSALYEYAAKTV